MSRRKLRPDELELWQLVARSAEKLPGRKMAPETPAPKPAKLRKPIVPRDPVESFTFGTRAPTPQERHDHR